MATKKSSNIALSKPKSIWQRKVKVDLKPLFVALGKATAHAASLKFDEIAGDLTGAVTSLGLDVPPNELAFILIQRSLLEAMLTLTQESATHIGQEIGVIQTLSKSLEKALENLDLKFDVDFFKQPGELKLVSDLEGIYSQWLCDCGMSPQKSRVVASRLRSYFVFSLANEWRKNAGKYQLLVETSSSPFVGAEAYERGWQTYFAYLEKRISENVFDEPFSLKQIYIPLNAYYVEKIKNSRESKDAFSQRSQQIVVDLEEELLRETLNKSTPIQAQTLQADDDTKHISRRRI